MSEGLAPHCNCDGVSRYGDMIDSHSFTPRLFIPCGHAGVSGKSTKARGRGWTKSSRSVTADAEIDMADRLSRRRARSIDSSRLGSSVSHGRAEARRKRQRLDTTSPSRVRSRSTTLREPKWKPRHHRRPVPVRHSLNASAKPSYEPIDEAMPFATSYPVRCPKPRHVDTTQICIICGACRCWKSECSGVANAVRPLLDRHVCTSCSSRRGTEKLSAAQVVSKLRASEFMRKQYKVIEDLDLRSGGKRTSTKDAGAKSVIRIGKTIFQLSEIKVFGPFDVSVECLTAFVLHRALVDHVKYRTITRDIGVVNKWRVAMKNLIPSFPLPEAGDAALTKAVLDYAWDHCSHESHQRSGVDMVKLAAYIAKFRHATMPDGSVDRKLRQKALAANNLSATLVRRDACARIDTDPADASAELILMSEKDLSLVKSSNHFSLDKHGNISNRVRPTHEKNQPLSVSTTRYVTDITHANIPFASVSRQIIGEIYETRGPLLRRWELDGSESQLPWKSDDWNEFLDHYCAFSGHERSLLGAQSFRRGYATCLRDNGVSEEDIRFLGYWWSTVAREYTGTSRQARIDLQSKKQGAPSVAPRDPMFLFGNARPAVR